MKARYILMLLGITTVSFAQVSDILTSSIRVFEAKRPKKLYSSFEQNEVDINGIIAIKFDQEKISAALTKISGKPNVEAEEYSIKIRQLQSLLSSLQDYTYKGKKLFTEGDMNDEEWENYAAAGLKFYDEFEPYIASLPNSKEVTADYNKLVAYPVEASLYVNRLIIEELKKLNELSLKIKVGEKKFSFQITGKYLSKDGERMLNIPGYFDADTDNPTEYQKVKSNFSKEEKDAIRAQEEAYRKLIQLKDDFETVKKEFVSEINTLVESLKNIEAAGTKILNYDISHFPVDSTLSTFWSSLPITQKDKLQNIYNSSITLSKDVNTLTSSLKKGLLKLEDILSDLKSGNSKTSSDAMFSILEGIDDITNQIGSTAKIIVGVADKSAKLGEMINTLTEKDFVAISANAVKTLGKLPEVANFFSSLDSFKENLNSIVALSQKTADKYFGPLLKQIQIEDNKEALQKQIALTMNLSPDLLKNIQVRNQDELMNTSINLLDYKNRNDGDYIKLRIIIKDDLAVVTDDQYTIKVNSFEWNSTLYTGLIFVKKNTEREFYPTVSVSWMLKYWGRQEVTSRDFLNSFGFGFHTTTLVIDNNKTQIGVGPSFHVFNNLIQVGFGWNLGANASPYYFAGIGLIDLLNKVK